MAKTDSMNKPDKAAKANKSAKPDKTSKANKSSKPGKPDKANAKNTDSSNGAGQDAQNEAKKQRKQQAKQDAKLMLKIEDAKKDVEKAQQKVIKAQEKLNAAQAHFHKLEEKRDSQKVVALLPEGHTEHMEPHDEQSNANNQSMNGTTATTSTPTDQTTGQPPAEGRSDISDQPQSQETETTSTNDTTTNNTPSQENSQEPVATEQTGTTENIEAVFSQLPPEDTQIESDNASMPILTQDEHAWPPPALREEVAEASVEVVQNESAQEGNQGNAPIDSQTGAQQETALNTSDEAYNAQAIKTDTVHDTQSSSDSDTGSEHLEHATPEVPDNDATQVVEHYGEETHQQE